VSIPAKWSSLPDWMRIVAGEVNPRISGYPFPPLAAAPSGVDAGFTYYDTALSKVRTWDGAAWNNHW
jgi:hypothetical protein